MCAVRDGCSRRVIGWAIDEHLRTDLVESALSMAVAGRACQTVVAPMQWNRYLRALGGRVPPFLSRVTTLTAGWDEAPAAYAAKTTKVVLQREPLAPEGGAARRSA